MFTFHTLFTFRESIDKQHPLFNLLQLLYVCGGEGYCELLLILQISLFIVHAILLFQVHS